jgi:hypothetical protein
MPRRGMCVVGIVSRGVRGLQSSKPLPRGVTLAASSGRWNLPVGSRHPWITILQKPVKLVWTNFVGSPKTSRFNLLFKFFLEIFEIKIINKLECI